MFCQRCQLDVHPAKTLGGATTTMQIAEDGSMTAISGETVHAGGFYNQCPKCSSILPDPEPSADDAAVPNAVQPEAHSASQIVRDVSAKQQPKRTGGVLEDARLELAYVDAEIASMMAEVGKLKTEIQLKRAHRNGLMAVLRAYERAARPRVPTGNEPDRQPNELLRPITIAS